MSFSTGFAGVEGAGNGWERGGMFGAWSLLPVGVEAPLTSFPIWLPIWFNSSFASRINLFGSVRPDYYAAVTDAFITYPWEINRGPDQVLLGEV